MINKEQLKSIIKDLKEVIIDLGLSISEEVILREAATYQRGMLANQNKNQNKDSSNDTKQKPISEKQAGFLAELGYEGSYNLTSYQASKEIAKLKEKREKSGVKTNMRQMQY